MNGSRGIGEILRKQRYKGYKFIATQGNTNFHDFQGLSRFPGPVRTLPNSWPCHHRATLCQFDVTGHFLFQVLALYIYQRTRDFKYSCFSPDAITCQRVSVIFKLTISDANAGWTEMQNDALCLYRVRISYSHSCSISTLAWDLTIFVAIADK